jgi:hypothetical protein
MQFSVPTLMLALFAVAQALPTAPVAERAISQTEA